MSLVLNASSFISTIPDASGNISCNVHSGTNNTTSVTINANTEIDPYPSTGIGYFSQCFYNGSPILGAGSYTPGGGSITITPADLQVQPVHIGTPLKMMFYSEQTYRLAPSSTTIYTLPNQFVTPGGSSNTYGGLQTSVDFTVQPCNAPTLIATPSNAKVSLSWTAPDDGGSPITNYIVQYSLNANDWVTFQHPVSNATSMTVTGLTNGLTYYFQVAGVNGYCGGDGPESGLFSNIATSTPSFSPPWSRAGGNNCPNCDSNYGTSACGSNGMPYSTYALDERRKTEILKYKKNGAQMSKAQQYSMLSRNALTRKKSWATQTQTYTNPNVNNLPERESEGVTVALECNQPPVLYSLTSDCDVPGPVIPLYIDAKIPLYNYKMQVTPSSGGK